MSVETLPFLAAVRRMIRSAGRRVADADEFELAELLALRAELELAIQTAVDGQLATGRTWADIAVAAGTTRQAAHKRWSRRQEATPELLAGCTCGATWPAGDEPLCACEGQAGHGD